MANQPKTTTKPEAKATATEPATEPTVEVTPALSPGQTVLHENGEKYQVATVFEAGIKLSGVANLVSPSSLSLP